MLELFYFRKCSLPMNPYMRQLVGQSVLHNFLKGWVLHFNAPIESFVCIYNIYQWAIEIRWLLLKIRYISRYLRQTGLFASQDIIRIIFQNFSLYL